MAVTNGHVGIKEFRIKFYEKLGGKVVKTKEAKIGDKYYKEYGFYFQLK